MEMEFELNRLRTFYLMPDLSTFYKRLFAYNGFFMDRSKQNVTCFLCNTNNKLYFPYSLILDEHLRCRKKFKKHDYKIQSPYKTIELTFPSNLLFEEFRKATFSNLNDKTIDLKLKEFLAENGFYFSELPFTVKCAYCDLIVIDPKNSKITKAHFESDRCLIKKKLKNKELKKLDGNYFEKNYLYIQNDVNSLDTGSPSSANYRTQNKKLEAGSSYLKITTEAEQNDINDKMESLGLNDSTTNFLRSAILAGVKMPLIKDYIASKQKDIESVADLSQILTFFIDYQQKQETQARHELLAIDFNKCKICHDERACILFAPCHHKITCQRCSSTFIKCPACDQKIISKTQVFS